MPSPPCSPSFATASPSTTGGPGGQWDGATWHQTESFDLGIVRCLCKLHQHSQKKLPRHIGLSAEVGFVSVLHSHTHNLNTVCDMMGGSIPSWGVSKKKCKSPLIRILWFSYKLHPEWTVNHCCIC